MEAIMASINESWHWLGPLLLVCFGTILVAVAWDILRDAVDEMWE